MAPETLSLTFGSVPRGQQEEDTEESEATEEAVGGSSSGLSLIFIELFFIWGVIER